MAPVAMVSADAVTAGLVVVVPADAVAPADADWEPDMNFRFPMSLIHPPESPPPS